jgi:hypothetical protein
MASFVLYVARGDPDSDRLKYEVQTSLVALRQIRVQDWDELAEECARERRGLPAWLADRDALPILVEVETRRKVADVAVIATVVANARGAEGVMGRVRKSAPARSTRRAPAGGRGVTRGVSAAAAYDAPSMLEGVDPSQMKTAS